MQASHAHLAGLQRALTLQTYEMTSANLMVSADMIESMYLMNIADVVLQLFTLSHSILAAKVLRHVITL